MLLDYDLILMSLDIFVPAIFALGLLFFPRGSDEAMRWWSLAGTALTLGLSLCAFINFKQETVDRNLRPANEAVEGRAAMLLDRRVADADQREASSGPRRGDDWVSRQPWIAPFNIDYFLGADGISMALVL